MKKKAKRREILLGNIPHSSLSHLQNEVLGYYYALVNHDLIRDLDSTSFKMVGVIIGKSKERVRQIHDKALFDLDKIEERFWGLNN